MSASLFTPNEVDALAETAISVADDRFRQNPVGATAGDPLPPLHAVALAAAAKKLGRRLTEEDKKRMALEIASMSPAALKTAEIELAPSVVVLFGELTRDAVVRAERYAAARDAYIEFAEGVQGGRPVIRGTRLTISSIFGRLSTGDTIETLVEDYPDIPREAFETAFLFAKTHPEVVRAARRPA